MSTSECERILPALLESAPGTPLSPEVQAHLAACPGCDGLLAAHQRTSATLRGLSLWAPDRVWRAIEARRRPAIPWTTRLLASLTAISRPAWALAAAAAILIAFVAGRSQTVPFETQGTVSLAGGAPLAQSGRLAAGGSIIVSEGAHLRLRPRSGDRIEVEGPARLQVRATDRLSLEEGRAHFTIARRTTPMVVDVPAGTVTVMGTRFALEAGRDLTRIQLHEGRLELRPRSGPPRIIAGAASVVMSPGGVDDEVWRGPLPGPDRSVAPAPATTPSVERPTPKPVPSERPVTSVTPVRPARSAQGGF